MKRYKKEWIEHIDHLWIDKKIGEHGGSYTFNTPDGLVIINYIGDKGSIKIFWYNIILCVRYLIRKVVTM